jgi:peptidoglycan hydrolase CwlO-like protein
MEEIIKAVVDNGLGVASFIALIYFMFKYVATINTTLSKISDVLKEVTKSQKETQKTLTSLNDRIERLELELKKKEKEK